MRALPAFLRLVAPPLAGMALAVQAVRAAPEDAASTELTPWLERAAAYYQHYDQVEVSGGPEGQTKLPLACADDMVEQRLLKKIAFEPGLARIMLHHDDENLFQSATITLRRLAEGVDTAAVLAEASKSKCWSDKRYNLVVQAGDLLFWYSARCSNMYTPFVYDAADLVGFIAAGGATPQAQMLAIPCGNVSLAPRPTAEVKADALKARTLYQHRFPAARDKVKADATP